MILSLDQRLNIHKGLYITKTLNVNKNRIHCKTGILNENFECYVRKKKVRFDKGSRITSIKTTIMYLRSL